MRRTLESDSAPGGVRRRLAQAGFHCVVWSLVGVVLLPILWPLLMALHGAPLQVILDRGALWWLRGIEFGALVSPLVGTPFLRVLGNSILVATVAAAITTALAVAGAYGVDRFSFRGRRTVWTSLLVFPLVPQTVILIPLFLYFRRIGLFNTHVGLVVAYVALTLPFATWLVRPLISNVPSDPEDAAIIDGCTRFGAFLHVFLPAARPTVAAAFSFSWIIAYNEYFFAVVLINDTGKRTLPVGLRYGVGDPGVVSVLAAVPILLLFGVLWHFFLAENVQQLRY